METIYKLLDFLFVVVHSFVIVFNLLGWIPKRTRRANLILLLITGGSWFVLGLWKGIGYCPLTDLHYKVLENLGETNLPPSYIAYFMNRVLGWRLSDQVTDTLTASLYAIALLCSVRLHIQGRRAKVLNA